MPLHDYECLRCGKVFVDQYRSVEEGGQASPPYHCDVPMSWLPACGRMDSFTPFETYDGKNRPIVIDSLHKMRQVERESERMAQGGEGQQITFRMWSQNESNRLVNTHGPDPGLAPTREAARRFSPTRHGEVAPDRALGPAVTEQNTSALQEG